MHLFDIQSLGHFHIQCIVMSVLQEILMKYFYSADEFPLIHFDQKIDGLVLEGFDLHEKFNLLLVHLLHTLNTCKYPLFTLWYCWVIVIICLETIQFYNHLHWILENSCIKHVFYAIWLSLQYKCSLFECRSVNPGRLRSFKLYNSKVNELMFL